MTQTVSISDLRRAFEAHVECLQRCGITYEGRLGLEEGSKLYGRAFRLYRTDVPWPCQNKRVREVETGELFRYRADMTGTEDRSFQWDHAGCEWCNGTKIECNTGHHRPPVGDDYLGMTKAEAYETLTARTRTIYDTAAAIQP